MLWRVLHDGSTSYSLIVVWVETIAFLLMRTPLLKMYEGMGAYLPRITCLTFFATTPLICLTAALIETLIIVMVLILPIGGISRIGIQRIIVYCWSGLLILMSVFLLLPFFVSHASYGPM
jgi:hypothetical protein